MIRRLDLVTMDFSSVLGDVGVIEVKIADRDKR